MIRLYDRRDCSDYWKYVCTEISGIFVYRDWTLLCLSCCAQTIYGFFFFFFACKLGAAPSLVRAVSPFTGVTIARCTLRPRYFLRVNSSFLGECENFAGLFSWGAAVHRQVHYLWVVNRIITGIVSSHKLFHSQFGGSELAACRFNRI